MTPRSVTSRSAGTAAISLWTWPFTSAHQARAAAFAALRSAQPPSASGWDDQITLGVADQRLDHPLRLGVRRLAEVRLEAVPRRELHVLRVRHHHVRDRPGPQAAHPIRQHHAGHAVQLGEALGQQLAASSPASGPSPPARTDTDSRPAPRRRSRSRPRCPSPPPGAHPASAPTADTPAAGASRPPWRS